MLTYQEDSGTKKLFFTGDIGRPHDKILRSPEVFPQADFIIRKVKEEFLLDPTKTVIALRAKDFKNRNECENLINELSTTINATKFALHDLETFVKLDELSVMQEK